jgi:hypothetical protein
MADTTCSLATSWQTIKGESAVVVERLKESIHEGKVRRVVIQHGGHPVAEFPLTAGVIRVVIAPVLAAIGALVALLKDCTIQIERESSAETPGDRTRAAS